MLAMGGPMGAGDDADHPWLGAEKQLVREAVADDQLQADLSFALFVRDGQ
mgnify:CR=1 FL=1